MYFDQSLQAEVEAYEPYRSNPQPLTSNTEDGLLAFEAGTTDPMMEYVLLGRDVEDGILGWISIGIDPTETRPVSAKEKYYKAGGAQPEVSAAMRLRGWRLYYEWAPPFWQLGWF
jgi:hypothetical protein